MNKYKIGAGSLVWLFQYRDTSVPGKYTSSESKRQRYITELPVTYFSKDIVPFLAEIGKWIENEMQRTFAVNRSEFLEKHVIFRLPMNDRDWGYLVVRMSDVELSEVEI